MSPLTINNVMNLLHSLTQPEWLTQALSDLDAILLDHAQCEKKAAGTAMRYLFQYPNHQVLVEALTTLAREELQHFQMVNRHLDRRGVTWKTLKPAPYGNYLKQEIHTQEPARLLDSMLVSCLIEARSHERLELLAKHCPDPELQDFYAFLGIAEERHKHLYLDLAYEYYAVPQVEQRLHALSKRESDILQSLYPAPRIHS
jgi:tRNA 2-(methylsulfanyl)-N6-isopentenyladenosine37 hydroxylase